jgi:transcriptional regulator with XRE-family HTH domain
MKYGQCNVTVNSDFQEWRMEARRTREECAALFDVDIRTIRNWETGKIKPPRAVFLCLAFLAGRLDFLGEHWRGFRMASDGCLVSPSGGHVWWYEVDAIRYLYQAAERDRGEILKEIRKKRGIRMEWEK